MCVQSGRKRRGDSVSARAIRGEPVAPKSSRGIVPAITPAAATTDTVAVRSRLVRRRLFSVPVSSEGSFRGALVRDPLVMVRQQSRDGSYPGWAEALGVVGGRGASVGGEVTREGLCQQALQSFEQWRTRDLPYPPYVVYLCLFVLAAGVEGDFAPHAYYPRLRHLLDYKAGSTLPSFDRMLPLWDDLAQWSTQDRAGELGIFEARIAGGWVHVGLPLAQTILTEHERNALVRIFSRSALDPTSPPADAELAALLRQRGTGHLRPRTLELLATRSDEDRYEVLLDTVAEELGAWDGQFEGDVGGDAPSVPGVAGALRLCLRVDPVAARVKATLRCRLNREFPEGGLLLTQPESTQEVSCIESAPGWSTPLTDDQTQDAVDAAGFDWSEGVTLEDRTLGWRFGLRPSAVRIFVDGSGYGLPGLVEVPELQRSQPFHLLFASEAWEGLEAWARTECRGYQECEIRGGLPSGWRLASIEAAEKDSSVRNAFPILEFSERIRLTFRGGIRSSVGNTLLRLCPAGAVARRRRAG